MATIWFHPIIKNIKREWVLHSLLYSGKKAGLFSNLIEYPNSYHPKISDQDLLIIWNRHLNQDDIAKKFERIGAKVLVLENPYLQPNKITRDYNPWVSFGRGYHNNPRTGVQCLDTGERWISLGQTIAPWKQIEEVKNVLICTQAKKFNAAGLGFELNKQPENWDGDTIMKVLGHVNKPKTVFRTHPNSKDVPGFRYRCDMELGSTIGLQESLYKHKTDSMVVHTSNSNVRALLQGIPVAYTGPNIFLKDLCTQGILQGISNPKLNIDRKPSFERLAWNQMSLKDIDSGLFFDIIYENLFKTGVNT